MISVLEKKAVRQAALPLTVEQYHQLCEAGIIPENTELLEGVLIEKMGKSPQHTWLVQWLVEWLRSRLPEGVFVRQEQPLTFADSEPEPDVAIVAGTPRDYRASHPTSAQLVIEVAISSEDLDREKGHAYALAGIPEYWLVLPSQGCIEVRTSPIGQEYQQTRVYRQTDSIIVRCCANAELRINELMSFESD